MTEIPNNLQRRREPRYNVLGQGVDVVVQRSSAEEGETVQGELLDLSPGGVQLRLPTYLQFLEVIGICIVVPEAKVNIDATAEVCWIRPTDDNKCLVGCSFTLRISDAVVERLATAGFIDRRRHPRLKAEAPALARWELDAEEFSIRIIDYSEGGFRMVTDRPGTVGATVSVEIGAPDDEVAQISADVCWQEERDGEYCFGCVLKSSDDFQRLDEFVGKFNAAKTKSSKRGETSRLPFLAATLLFLFIGSTFLGLKATEGWRTGSPETLPEDAQYNAVAFTRLSNTAVAATGETFKRNPFESAEHDEKPEPDEKAEPDEKVGPDERAEPYKTSGVIASEGVDIGAVAAQETVQEPAALIVDTLDTPDLAAPANPKISTLVESVIVDHVFASDFKGNQDAPPATNDHAENEEHLVTQEHGATQEHLAEGEHGATQSHVDTPKHVEIQPLLRVVNTDEIKPSPAAMSERHVDITKAKNAFVVGDRFYRGSRFQEALSAFQTAIEHDSRNAFHFYLLAMTHYQLRQFQEAETAVQNALRLEKERPIENWGSRVSRYQGRPRLWVEQLRSKQPR